MVPNTDWFLYGFVRKEAVLTSQIEGVQATLPDVVTYDATARTERFAELDRRQTAGHRPLRSASARGCPGRADGAQVAPTRPRQSTGFPILNLTNAAVNVPEGCSLTADNRHAGSADEPARFR